MDHQRRFASSGGDADRSRTRCAQACLKAPAVCARLPITKSFPTGCEAALGSTNADLPSPPRRSRRPCRGAPGQGGFFWCRARPHLSGAAMPLAATHWGRAKNCGIFLSFQWRSGLWRDFRASGETVPVECRRGRCDAPMTPGNACSAGLFFDHSTWFSRAALQQEWRGLS